VIIYIVLDEAHPGIILTAYTDAERNTKNFIYKSSWGWTCGCL